MKPGRRSKKASNYELSTLGDTQFDVIDKFDMFQNPHDVDELTEQYLDNLNELYGVSDSLAFSNFNFLTVLILCFRAKNIQIARLYSIMLAAAMSTALARPSGRSPSGAEQGRRPAETSGRGRGKVVGSQREHRFLGFQGAGLHRLAHERWRRRPAHRGAAGAEEEAQPQ